LRGLLGDGDTETAAAAAVSLLLLGDDSGHAQLLNWMEQCTTPVLRELSRVADAKRLERKRP